MIKAILIIYNGEDLNEGIVSVIAENMRTMTNATNVDVFSLDKVDSVNPTLEDDAMTPEDKAVVLIGTMMKNQLSSNPSTFEFAKELLHKIEVARNRANSKNNRAFINALFILSQEDLRISRHLLEKYHLNEELIRVIKSIYHSVVSV